ncbi:hypothetical protein [Ravibacter arvi]
MESGTVKNYLNGFGIEGEKKMLLEEFQAHNSQMEALSANMLP